MYCNITLNVCVQNLFSELSSVHHTAHVVLVQAQTRLFSVSVVVLFCTHLNYILCAIVKEKRDPREDFRSCSKKAVVGHVYCCSLPKAFLGIFHIFSSHKFKSTIIVGCTFIENPNLNVFDDLVYKKVCETKPKMFEVIGDVTSYNSLLKCNAVHYIAETYVHLYANADVKIK